MHLRRHGPILAMLTHLFMVSFELTNKAIIGMYDLSFAFDQLISFIITHVPVFYEISDDQTNRS
jgi:hypothetical protein